MRIALGLEYDGSQYYGWQRQREVISVQQHLEEALSKVANETVEVAAWTLGVNSNLPDGIAVRWAKPVANDFSARFSAIARRYRYIIANTRLRPGIHSSGVSHYHQPLNERLMHEAAQALIGEHDFTSFRAAQCQSHSANRNVTRLEVTRKGDFVIVDISANAFLHHMVRNIVGSLIVIGQEQQPTSWLKELLELKDRTQAAATAKPGGLYLVAVTYPDDYEIPVVTPGPLWLE